MNVLEKIDEALNGTPRPVNAQRVICELAHPKVQKMVGFADWLSDERKIRALSHERSHGLGEIEAFNVFQRQQREHADLISAGKSSELPRGRTLEAWRADFENRRAAADDALIQLRKKLESPRKVIGSLCVDQLHAECASLMINESKLASKYGIVYQESPTLSALKNLQNVLQTNGHSLIFDLLTK
jgi:hypothetical protein